MQWLFPKNQVFTTLPSAPKGENCNRKNTLWYFEDYNLSLTPKSGKLTIYAWMGTT
jgi:hypothetical protein